MHDVRNVPALRREVLPPATTSSGWGLVLVAATALSCALAGSLLMVRASAEMARERRVEIIVEPAQRRPIHVDLQRARPVIATPPPTACGGPVYHANGDGRAEAVFELCPPKTGQIKRIVAP
jgi:hypothetical protein